MFFDDDDDDDRLALQESQKFNRLVSQEVYLEKRPICGKKLFTQKIKVAGIQYDINSANLPKKNL